LKLAKIWEKKRRGCGNIPNLPREIVLSPALASFDSLLVNRLVEDENEDLYSERYYFSIDCNKPGEYLQEISCDGKGVMTSFTAVLCMTNIAFELLQALERLSHGS
jgi:hypothetical protein